MRAAPTLVCASLEVALNRYLQIEPAALAECEAMAKQRIAYQLENLDWQLFIEFGARGVRVINESAEPASVTLVGPPHAFAMMAGKLVGGDTSLPAGLRVEGDAEVLQRFRRLLASVGFDIEEWIAPLLGDGAAHRAAQSLKSLFNWGRASSNTMAQNTAEYLVEETRDLARGVDVVEWMDEVDRLRERTDRIDARMSRLERSKQNNSERRPA
jgi:ubiquinone biosynthesis protein UbiJ